MRALDNHDARENVTENTLDAAIHYFEKMSFSISIPAIVNLSGAWIITVPNGDLYRGLYTKVRSASTMFLQICMGSRTTQGSRIQGLQNRTRACGNQNRYEILQPGLMLGVARSS